MIQSLQTLAKSVAVFLFLFLSLWWSLVSVAAYPSERSKSFFHFEHENDVRIEFPQVYAKAFESALFSAVALPGHMCVTDGGGGLLSTVGGFKEFLWLSLTPWLITFAQSWISNIGYFLWNVDTAMAATNFRMFAFLWISGLIVQALLWSEVCCVALQGWMLMKNDFMVRRKLFTSRFQDEHDYAGDFEM